MIPDIKISGKIIGSGQPLFIIAEIGVTCNYDLAITKDLILAVKAAGGDAVKFIFWFPDEIMSDRSITYTYQTVNGPVTENMYEMLSKLRFTPDQWQEVQEFCQKQGIIMFATVNSPGGVALARFLGLEAIKLSSWDYNYLPLFPQVASLGKPVFMDLGPVRLWELARVLDRLRAGGVRDLVLLHCSHSDNMAEINLRTIPYLQQTLHTWMGFSAEGREDDLDLMAVALGAVVVEKRLTLSRNLPGHHHLIAKEPGEFAAYVARLRRLQEALGTCTLKPSAADLKERRRWFRHLVAASDIPRGTLLTPELLACKRPEAGISPEFLDLFVGRVTTRNLRADEALTWQDVT